MDAQYFKDLLSNARTECQKYELPQKDAIRAALSKFSEAAAKTQKAEKKENQMKKRNEPKEEREVAKQEHHQLKEELEKVREEIMNTLEPILNEIELGNDEESSSPDLQVNLMKCAILNQAGPKELANFCIENDPGLITELLESKSVMKEMLLNGGAAKGNWGRAYQLYKELMGLIDEDDKFSSCHKRLAMGVALEHANPVSVFDAPGVFVDPIQRFLHFVEAHKKGELDPAFPYFSAWEYRYIVDCNGSDDQLQWGRDHLKRYRPDQVAMDDMHWRYAVAVKSDVGYRAPNWTSRPKTFQQLVSGGGKCGPRAWYGRYICKSFGIPTWGVRQPGHAAMGRWTPKKGWETVLGGGWRKSHWEGRRGEAFKAEAHARAFQHKDTDAYYRKITFLECMAEAYDEKALQGEKEKFSPKFLRRSLINAQRRIWASKATEEHFRRGPEEKEEAGPCCLLEFKARKDKPTDDNEIEVLENGTIKIPANAFSKQVKTTAMLCFEGGGQLLLENSKSYLEYKMPDHVPEQDYELTCKICNVHLQHENEQLLVMVNTQKSQVASIPYTIGEWGYTKPVRIHLGKGDVLKFSRKGEKCFGLTMKQIMLMPC